MSRTLCDALMELGNPNYSWPPVKKSLEVSKNRAQNQGEDFETLCKDFLSGVNTNNFKKRDLLYSTSFSYTGSKSYPPDAMYRGGNDGDAFEIKKSESRSSELQINSSFPYSHIEPALTRIASTAKNSETWTRRDLHYVVGNVDRASVESTWIWIVHGRLIAADINYYSAFEAKIREAISKAVESIGGVVSETNELGRINEVDPLGHANLRIRGMWLLKNPQLLFEELSSSVGVDPNDYPIKCLMTQDKWHSLLSRSSVETQEYWENPEESTTNIGSVKVVNPDIDGGLIDAKLIQVKV